MKLLKTKSGLQVLFRHMDSGLVDIRYFIKCGSIDEIRPQDHGLCHALEHMLYAGTKNRTWMEMNRALEKVGSSSNAYTCNDRTIYKITCIKKYWKNAYEILTDMLYNPTLPEQRWEDVEKGAIISEIQEEEDGANYLLSEGIYIDSLGTKYHPIMGNVNNIRNASITSLKSFYDRYYCSSNILLTIVGDLTETQVINAINKYDRLSSQKPPKRKKETLKFNYKSFSVQKQGLEQSNIQLLKPLKIPRTIKDCLALEVVTTCLNQYIFEELREKLGLCYWSKAELNWDIPNNLFLSIETATDNIRFNKTKKTLSTALQNFQKEGLTTQRINNNKIAEICCVINYMEQIQESPDWMWDIFEKKIIKDPFEFKIKNLETISNKTIKSIAKKYFVGRIKFGKITEK